MQSQDDVLAIARSYSEAFNARDWSRLSTLLAPDIIDESIRAQVVRHGSDEVAASLRAAADARPDARIEIVNGFASGDQAALQLRMIATEPDSGKTMALPTCHIYRVREGKIDRLTTYSDGTWREPA
jgi:steroid delta-isomerase-like uncharacterized protein